MEIARVSRKLLLTVATAWVAASAFPAAAQSLDGHPYRTMSATPLPLGAHVLEFGLEHRTSAVPQPLLSPVQGDLTRAPEIRYRIGFGRAELSVGIPGWQSFSPDSKLLDSQDEGGDFSFWATVNALKQRRGRPALAFALGAKLPNASDESGLGTDESDTFLAILLGHAMRDFEWRFNLGLAILGDPLANSSQEDLLTYGLAGRHGRRHCFAWEIYGRTLSSDDARELDESTLELGYVFIGRRVTAELSLLTGLTENSGDLGASAGVAWRFGSSR